MPPVQPSQFPFRVGVVDDDGAGRDSLTTLLQSHGIDTIDFASAQAFLQSPLRKTISCLLVDLQMPDMSGLELIEKLRSEADRTPSLLMTSQPETGLGTRIRRANVTALLLKPAQQNELLGWIEHVKALPVWRQ